MAPARSESWRAGWAVGGGGEYRFASNWSVKLEYLYYDLGSEKYTIFNPLFPFTPGPARGFDSTADFTGHIARVGLNYKFGSGPVVAKILTRRSGRTTSPGPGPGLFASAASFGWPAIHPSNFRAASLSLMIPVLS